jgi:hypothetical protein
MRLKKFSVFMALPLYSVFFFIFPVWILAIFRLVVAEYFDEGIQLDRLDVGGAGACSGHCCGVSGPSGQSGRVKTIGLFMPQSCFFVCDLIDLVLKKESCGCGCAVLFSGTFHRPSYPLVCIYSPYSAE